MYCPRPLWNTHSHDHSVVTIEYIRWAVKEHFGLDPAEEPKLEYLSEKTWNLMLKRKGLRKQLELVSTLKYKLNIRTLFKSLGALLLRKDEWFDFGTLQYGAGTMQQHADQLTLQYDETRLKLNSARGEVRASIKEDYKKNVSEVAVRAQAAAAAKDTKELHKCIADLTPKKRRVPQGVLDKNGNAVVSHKACRQRWQEFFADKVGGVVKHLAELLKGCTERQRDVEAKLAEGVQILPQSIPSITQIGIMFSKLKAGKGHG